MATTLRQTAILLFRVYLHAVGGYRKHACVYKSIKRVHIHMYVVLVIRACVFVKRERYKSTAVC